GHLAYRHADAAAVIRRYPDRIGYVHIKQMDPAVVARADRDGLAFGQAVALGASCEPPAGEPSVDEVAAVTDADPARAAQVAAGLPGTRLHPTGQDLIADGDVDAVLVTSWGATHEEYVLAAIAAGKRVFCEKPLAPTAAGALRIVEAELGAGRRLVQVGFMRRYDAGYNAIKDALDAGQVGAPLLMHCAHRNPAAPPYGFTTDMIISDSAVHELDLVRWLFDEEIAAVTVLRPRPTSKVGGELQDPLVLLLEMASGTLVDVEVFVNAGYGYDIRAEVVGESGTLALADAGGAVVSRQGQRGGRVPADWRERFG